MYIYNFQLLLTSLRVGKLRHTEQINQMIFMHKCLMLSVLYFLKLGFMHHLRIIQAVLVYIFSSLISCLSLSSESAFVCSALSLSRIPSYSAFSALLQPHSCQPLFIIIIL